MNTEPNNYKRPWGTIGGNMSQIGDRVRALREMYGMTGQEVADLGGLKNSSQVSKVENGHNLATTLHIRVGLAKGFGLTLDEFNNFIDERMDVQRAHALGYPRISGKLKDLRRRVDMSHQDELEEAIARTKVDPAVVIFARRIAASGVHQPVGKWIELLRYLESGLNKLSSGKQSFGD